MPLLIKVTPRALRDIQKGIDHYNRQQKGLGARFESTIDGSLKKIASMPLSASYAYESVRYKVVNNFPFIILYETDEASVIVLRVYNTHLSGNDIY